MEEAPEGGVVKALTLDEARRKRPVVDFNVPGGGIRHVMIEPETWKVEQPNGDIQASRTQVRLNNFCTYPSHVHSDAIVSSHLSMGDVYTQITRSDTGEGESRPRQSFREGYSFSVLDFLPRADHSCEPGSGQAYVALSRATSLEGLQVLNFSPSKARQSIHLLCVLLTVLSRCSFTKGSRNGAQR